MTNKTPYAASASAGIDLDRARSALYSISPDIPRDEWAVVGMASQDAGLSFDDFDNWSSQSPKYDAKDTASTWRSFKPGRGVTAATLFGKAKDFGWSESSAKHQAPPPKPKPSTREKPPVSANEVWDRSIPATPEHPYISAKKAEGAPLDGLRMLSKTDPLVVGGQKMAGSLVVPVYGSGGILQSLQLIPPSGPKKNLAGHPISGGRHIVGSPEPGQPLYVCEGIGQAWACWRATGHAAAVYFGWPNAKTAAEIAKDYPGSTLVLVPDAGKNEGVKELAKEIDVNFVQMPEGEENNFDIADLAQRDGDDILQDLLERIQRPPKPEPKFKLLDGEALRDLPPLKWRIRGVLPEQGVAAIYGPSASGKSFLAFDMATAVADGQTWFGHRVNNAPVIYLGLEGEAGFKLRAEAWEVSRGRSLPKNLWMVLQGFRITDPLDVLELAKVVPKGSVIIIDTMNRAAPTSDENNSKDMGEILEGLKTLQRKSEGLVVVVHHTGKDAAKGLRGHSSLFAAMDAVIEVERNGDARSWRVAKAKDGKDGEEHSFKLKVEILGTEPTGEVIDSCVVEMGAPGDAVAKVQLPKGKNQRAVLMAIRNACYSVEPGRPGAPAGVKCITMEDAVAAGASALVDTPKDKRNSLAKDAIRTLLMLHLRQEGDWIWSS